MAIQDTVFARSKRNGGFLTGARHSVLGSEDGMALSAAQGEPTPESAEREDAAPNYRDAESMDDCGGCAHFSRNDNHCVQFDFTTSPDKLCDAFVPAEEAPGLVPMEEGANIPTIPRQ